MQYRKKANTEAKGKIAIITPKNQQKNARLKRKLNGLKLASRSTKDEISHNQNLQILAPERLFLRLQCLPLTFKTSPVFFTQLACNRKSSRQFHLFTCNTKKSVCSLLLYIIHQQFCNREGFE